MFFPSRRFAGTKVLLALLLLFSLVTHNAYATGSQFLEPLGWSVGDLDSTFQEWDANLDFDNPANSFAFSSTGTLPSSSNISPTIASDPTLGVNLPGFPASSGGYYAFGGRYSAYADVFNHGGTSSAGGSYPSNYGTRVFVQTASIVSIDDISVFIDADEDEGINAIEIVQPDGSPIPGGDNLEKLQAAQLFVGDVPTPIGILPQEELLFEFWLPGYTDDFRVQFDIQQHSSFQHLRIDSQIQAPPAIDPDFDLDGNVDGADFLAWQRNPSDYDDAEGLAVWQAAYGGSANNALATVNAVPEPSTLTLMLFACLATFRRPRHIAVKGGACDELV